MVDANALQYASPAPERDAVDRLSRLHGALELKATLLALLLPAKSRRAERAFTIETVEIRQAPSLREHVANLPGAARLPWFEALLVRMALQPIPLRQELLQSTRRVMAARGVARPIDRLHWLAMRRGLGEALAAKPRGAVASDVAEWLEADLLAIANFTAFLSRLVPVEATGSGADWYASVMEPWQGGAALPACEPPDGEGAIRALTALQTLSLMQRPMVVRGWVAALTKLGGGRPFADSAADALRLSCGLLDTPMPPELARHFSAFEVVPK